MILANAPRTPVDARHLLQMAQSGVPVNGAAKVTVETTPDGVRIEEKVNGGDMLVGLDALVKDGTLRSYDRQGNTLVAWADSADAADRLAALERRKGQMTDGSVVDRMRQLLVPPNLSESVAPEYLKFRSWSLAGSVLSGAVGFMGASVNLDAMKVAFATGANAAMAGFVNGLVYKATAMGASYLARRGDADPKRWLLMSSLVNTTNGLLSVGMLSVFPQAYVPLNTYFSVTSAVSNTLGGAASINVFNHLARGDNKGVVQAKNANQDMLADALGAPLALGISSAASALGFNPYIATVGVLGPALAFCNLQAARALHLESLDHAGLQQIADGLIDQGQVTRAPHPTLLQSLHHLVSRAATSPEPGLVLTDSLDDIIRAAAAGGGKSEALLGLFKDEAYCLATRARADGKDEIVMTTRESATVQDMLKAVTHARLLRRVLDSSLPGLMPTSDRSLLVELTKRALPANLPDNAALAEQGWHPNLHALDLPHIDAAWSGTDPQRVVSLTTADLLRLIEKPDAAQLRSLLRLEQPVFG